MIDRKTILIDIILGIFLIFVGSLISTLVWNNIVIRLIPIFNPSSYWDMFWLGMVIVPMEVFIAILKETNNNG
jgi:hypothetical protein